MLGRDWAVTGSVIKGDARGRSIGFPTANIALGSLQFPAFGVYAVEVDLEEDYGQVRKLAMALLILVSGQPCKIGVFCARRICLIEILTFMTSVY